MGFVPTVWPSCQAAWPTTSPIDDLAGIATGAGSYLCQQQDILIFDFGLGSQPAILGEMPVRDPASAILGPSFGGLTDMQKALMGIQDQAKHEINPDWSPGMDRKQVQSFRRLPPGQNIIGIQQLVNHAIDLFGEHQGWAPAKSSFR